MIVDDYDELLDEDDEERDDESAREDDDVSGGGLVDEEFDAVNKGDLDGFQIDEAM